MAEKNTDPKISIIIPVYKVEKYLAQCLNSLVTQTFKDFEIIAVNDGSPDGSREILRRFEEKYDFITVLDQENSGQAQARNNGLKLARGEYVTFVDSDDYVAPNYLMELYRACEDNGADISCCYYYFRFPESEFLFEYPFRCHGVFTRSQALHKLLHDVQIQSLLWNKLYKRRLFIENEIEFPTMCFEDLAVLHKVFAKANKVVVLDEALYYYSQHSGSTLANVSANKINDYIRAIAMVRISLERNGLYEKYKKSFAALTRKTCGCCYFYVFKLHNRKKCMKGCFSNMRRVSRAIKHYKTDEFNPTVNFDSFPEVVNTPEKVQKQKDYSIR